MQAALDSLKVQLEKMGGCRSVPAVVTEELQESEAEPTVNSVKCSPDVSTFVSNPLARSRFLHG